MKEFKITKEQIILYVFTFIVILAGDQYTKYLVDKTLHFGTGYPIIEDFFYFTYVHNYGAAWGMLQGKLNLFYIISLVAAIGIIYYFYQSHSYQKYTRFGLVLIFSGMIGNLIDRIAFGYVRDFLDFIIFGYNFPIFNIADIAIVLGVGMLLLDIALEEYGTWKLSKSQ